MPDEERLRTKRRKLDSIITKLHQVTPLGSESLEEEENVNEEVKENVDKGDDSLPGSSRRKREKRHVAVDVTKSQATENGTEMECEQEVPCNGEGDTNDETHPAVVKQERGSESYENSLEGFQQMLGCSISEEVVTQKAEGGEKKKRLLSESSDADGHELPRRVECTACSRNVNPAHGTICRHPCLNVLICKKCNQYYNSGPFTRDEFGIDEQCRWCGDGGSLLCCDKCDKAFCKPCIKRNFGKSTLKKIVNAPEGTEWLCFCCNPKPLSKLVKACNRIMNILKTRKAQKTIFKTKKGGPSLSDTPNQKERRNRLSSLTENLGMSSDGALSPNESPAKKHMPDAEEDDSDEDHSVTKQSSKKSRTRSRDKEHNKQNGSSKKNVLIIDDDSGSDNAVQSVKVSKGKTVKVESDRRTKRKLEISAESEDEKSKKGSKTSQAKKSRTRKYSSHDSDSDVEKQNYKSKPTSKTRSKQEVAAQSSEEDDDSSDVSYSDDSDSDSDFVSMVKKKDSKSHKKEKTKRKAVLDSEVDEEEDRKTRTSKKTREAKKDNKKQKKGKGKKQAVSDSEDEEEESEKDRKTERSKRLREVKKDNKKQKKGKTKNRAVSDSEEEEESEEDGKRKRTRKRSVTQKQTRKRPRKVTSSEDESKSSEDQSDSDGPLTRNKKKQPQRQRKKKKVASESDEDSEEIGRKKKRKTRRKGKKSSSESEEDTRRSKRKGKGKGKGKQKSKKKHYIKKDSDESEDEDDEEDEDVSPSKRKGRKKIRKLITDEKLAVETRKARRLEEERRKRLLERTQNNEDDMPGESAKVTGLVLESDPSTKEPIVDVKEDLLQYFKPHQCKGIQFMYNCVIESVKAWNKEEPGSGCLLAHCMGLGKTLQVVALVHTLMTHKDINLQRVLVVAPLNTVLNWQVEFDKWLSVDDRLEVLILQEVGGDNWRRMDMLKHWLRYGGVLIMGYSMYRNLSQCYRIKSHTQKKIFKEALVDPGPELVVCDEGHILRNDGSAISKALNSIKTKRRIVLTGTPLQNNLIEYHCMVSFVKPNLLGTRKEFTNTFVNPIENGQCADSTAMDVQVMKQRCHVLHKMLQGCVQRRDYAVLIPFLPRKHEYVIKVRLSVLQRKLYQHFLSTFVFPEGTFGKKGVSLFSDYQALMRIWTHPWCLKLEALRRPERFVETDSMDDFVVHTDEEEEEEEVESESEKSTTSAEEEAQSSSESENERRRKKQGGRRGKKDSSSDKDNNIYDSEGTSEEEVLPQSSRKRAAATPSAQSSSNKASTSTVNIDGEDITVVAVNDGASTSQGNRRDKQAHKSKKIAKEEDGKAMIKNNGRQSRNSLNNSNNNSDLESAVGSTRSGTNFKDFEVEKEWYDEFLAEGDEFNVQLSGKLFLLMEILADAEAVGDKVLVFSQSLVTLDLIEKVLGGGDIGGDRENWCRGCDYFRMDGSTSAAMRQRWADIFNDEDNKNGRLFLISTKAGGLGINLVAANRVIVFDVSWNPSHDVQSIFRVYRFGQTKAVYVYRLIAQGTMEEKIYDRQVTKLSMSGRVVDEQQIERHFTAADLRELYTFNPDVLEEDKETEAGEEGAENDTGAGNGTEAANGTEAVKEMEIGNGTEAGKDPEAGDGTEAGNETEAVKETEAGKVTGVGNETEAGKKTEVLNETKAGKETEVVNEMEAGKKTGAGNETEAGKKTEVVSETEAGKETGVVSETEAGKKTEVVSEMEAGKETGAGNETEAGKESEAEVGKETNSGAANKANTGKEDGAAKETTERPTMPLPKDAVLADLINRLHPKWIVKYHEHDSLLQNIESEELTEEEMKAAWAAYEADKSGQAAPANARAMDPLQDHAQTQQQVVERIRLNTEMLQQIQQIRQQQEMQQRREIEERMQQVNQQRQQLYQQHRDALLQQHQRQQDEMRRQNQMRFVQHMNQPRPGQPLQLGQNTINVQTQLPSTAAAPRQPPPPTYLRFQLPPSIRLAAPPVGATPSAGTPPIVDLSLGPRSIVGALPNSNPQLIRQPQNAAPK